MFEGNSTGYVGGSTIDSDDVRSHQRVNYAFVIATKAGDNLLIMKIRSLMNKLNDPDQEADAIRTAMKFPCSIRLDDSNIKKIREALELES